MCTACLEIPYMSLQTKLGIVLHYELRCKESIAIVLCWPVASTKIPGKCVLKMQFSFVAKLLVITYSSRLYLAWFASYLGRTKCQSCNPRHTSTQSNTCVPTIKPGVLLCFGKQEMNLLKVGLIFCLILVRSVARII